MKWPGFRSPALVAATLIAVSTGLPACGGGGDGADPAVSFDGSWQGTWSTQANGAAPPTSGSVMLELQQSGASVTGTATFTGHSCLGSCSVSCRVSGHELSGMLDGGSFQVSFSGSCPESGHCSGPHHANTMTATYHIGHGQCGGESGAVQLAPIAALGSEAPAIQVLELILVGPSDADLVRVPVFERPEGAP